MSPSHYIMPFGKHKGQKLSSVPASYLLYCLRKEILKGDLRDHVIKHLDFYKGISSREQVLTPESTMPFGKYKGRQMQQIPALYLINIEERLKDGNIRQYIEMHRQELIDKAYALSMFPKKTK